MRQAFIWGCVALALCGLLVACAPSAAARAPDEHRAPSVAQRPQAGSEIPFSVEIRSPQPELDTSPDADQPALAAACGEADRTLVSVARQLAEEQSGAAGEIDTEALTYSLRAAGAPYVWPHAWLFEGAEGELSDARTRMQRWLASFNDGGARRCGVALVHQAGGRVVIGAVAADVLADLDPVPTRVRIGQWVDVRATLLVPAADTKLVVLGPGELPHATPTSFGNGRLQARFNADHEGAWLVQVLGMVDGGPRPLLEALIFAGVEPSRALATPAAPGEAAAQAVLDPRSALYQMVNAARGAERMPPLARDRALEELAQAHAEAMRGAHKTAHDVGDGDLPTRLERAGIGRRAGENVAHAGSAVLAQRTLWASPSHRENLLFPDFAVVGIGVALDADGTLWVCEELGGPADTTFPEWSAP